MDFEELLALLRNPGEDGLPESIYDDLSSSYALAVEGGAARAAELEAANEAAMAESGAEIARLKALNFDLLMAAGSDTESDNGGESEDEPTEPIGEAGIDALFKRD